MKVRGYAARNAGEPLAEFEYELPPLGPSDVEIKVSYCGICHSDIHMIDNDWEVSSYPLVPGHEIIGTLESVGSAITGLKPGDRVGVGWQAGSCLECERCTSGDENLCVEPQGTCVGRHGGFAERLVLDGRFVHPIGNGADDQNTAPLLCAGITVYSPLRRLAVPGARVGVIGIGGLGHLALQFARAMGCAVTAFSSSAAKEEEARSFGAQHFVASSDGATLEDMAGSLDFILSTVNANLDWAAYLNCLRPHGKLCLVGAVPEPLEIPAHSLLAGQRSLTASVIGNRRLIREMLEFAARNKVRAKTEVVPLAKVNEAIEKVRENKARYRIVLEIS
jgi:uncharacterized zinc-type alcohol dehydrogenase-like protein